MLQHAGLPLAFWAEALPTAACNRNIVPKNGQKKSPYELFMSLKPSVKHISVFGGRIFARVPEEKRRKLDPKAEPAILMKCISNNKYRVYRESTGRFKRCRHCQVDETVFPARKWISEDTEA